MIDLLAGIFIILVPVIIVAWFGIFAYMMRLNFIKLSPDRMRLLPANSSTWSIDRDNVKDAVIKPSTTFGLPTSGDSLFIILHDGRSIQTLWTTMPNGHATKLLLKKQETIRQWIREER